MIRKHGPLAVALLLAALFAVACGGGDKKSSNGGSSGTTTATQSSGTTATQSSGGGADVSDNPQVKAAVASCKQSIDSNPSVKDDIKGDLKAICDKAASGNPEDVKTAIKDVCVKIVESTVPSGSAQDQAKTACASAGG